MTILIYANRGAILNKLLLKRNYDKTENLDTFFRKREVSINTIVYLKGYSKATIFQYFFRNNLYNSNIYLPISIYISCNKYKINKFIYISTQKINNFFRSKDNKLIIFLMKIFSPYSYSKFEAENKLIKLSKNTNCCLLIIRLPIVIGLYPKGKLKILIKYSNFICKLNFLFRNIYINLISITNLDKFLIDIDLKKANENQFDIYCEKIILSKLIDVINMIKLKKSLTNIDYLSKNLLDDLTITVLDMCRK